MAEILSLSDDISFEHQVVFIDDSILKILSVKRYLPQRRLVCKGIWHNQIVFAKLFIGKNALRYANRDKAGVLKLSLATIKAPNLIGELAIKSLPGVALIFEAIEPSLSSEEVYQTSTSDKRFKLMQQLVETVAQHHKANLLQTDLHFKNFLVQQDSIYTLDGDGMRALSLLFKHHQLMHNLATLFSKMSVLDDKWIQVLYESYCKFAEKPHQMSDQKYVWQLTQKKRAKAARTYADKKVFRACTDVKINQNFKRFIACSPDFDAENITEDQLDLVLSDTQNRLKSGNTCTVGSALINNQTVVIKRYNIKSFWHGLKLNIFQNRAAKSWANAHRLTLLNIATAKPLALIETRFGWFKKRAYFLTQFIQAPDIATYFVQEIDDSIKEKVAYATAQLFYKLYLLRISHGDCKASNIKIVDNRPVLIDLDSMQAHRIGRFFGNWRHEKKHVKDLKRLMQNWASDAKTSAIFSQAFVQAYDEVDDCLQSSILERAKIA